MSTLQPFPELLSLLAVLFTPAMAAIEVLRERGLARHTPDIL
jgi:hypothetical protein